MFRGNDIFILYSQVSFIMGTVSNIHSNYIFTEKTIFSLNIFIYFNFS